MSRLVFVACIAVTAYASSIGHEWNHPCHRCPLRPFFQRVKHRASFPRRRESSARVAA
jgi:hypothetical protein